jgi:hypothetical protein
MRSGPRSKTAAHGSSPAGALRAYVAMLEAEASKATPCAIAAWSLPWRRTGPVDQVGRPRPCVPACGRRQLPTGAWRTEPIAARSPAELPDGGCPYGPPKSEAGQRAVCFADLIVLDLTWHLASFTASDDDALVFTSPTGSLLRRANFRRRVWIMALTSAGLPSIHFRDPRHTGNTLTDAGANLRELMERIDGTAAR